jgi:hypothetical protein
MSGGRDSGVGSGSRTCSRSRWFLVQWHSNRDYLPIHYQFIGNSLPIHREFITNSSPHVLMCLIDICKVCKGFYRGGRGQNANCSRSNDTNPPSCP